jgi:hypothetical protein
VIDNNGRSAANGSGRGPAPCAAAVMPPVQAGMLPSALPARSAPIGVRVVPSLAASAGATAACAGDISASISTTKTSQRRTDSATSRMLVAAGLVAWVLGGVETVRAAELWSDGDTSVQLDTTVQFTGLRRLSPPQSRLLVNPNADDGDRAFASGAASLVGSDGTVNFVLIRFRAR